MPESARPGMSATLAADEALTRRLRAGQRVIAMTSGEIGLPVLPLLAERLGASVRINAYGSVAGVEPLRAAAAGYWDRRGLSTDPGLVVCGPGSKALLFGLLLAIGGDVVVPVPGWVSYGAQAELAGARPIGVAVEPGFGGVPDPSRLRDAVQDARAAGRDPRSVVVTVPDNPTGDVAPPDVLRRLAETARELDLFIISDEIYRDLVFDPAEPSSSPAFFAPERTAVTTGLAKNLALGGWRIGIVRLPDSAVGHELQTRLIAAASQIWSAPAAPVQHAAATAFEEPPEVLARLAASRRLHAAVARAAADRFIAVGARLCPPKATCYLYPDFEPLRERLARDHGVLDGAGLVRHLVERHGVGLLPGSVFGEPEHSLRLRAATSRLYGETEEQRLQALGSDDPAALPWIADTLDRIGAALSELAATAPAT